MKFQAGIFAILNEKKKELQEKGMTIYNLSVGTPDFPTPPHIMQAVSEAAKDPENYKYSLTDRPFLIRAVQQVIQEGADPKEIVQNLMGRALKKEN